MKIFALNPPCPRAPLAPGQIADPTSLKRGEDYPDEWAKRQAKLAKQAKEAVRKFNETLLLLLPLLRPLLSSQRGYVKEACTQAKCFLSNALTARIIKALTANSSCCSYSSKVLSSSAKAFSYSDQILSTCASRFMPKDCRHLHCLRCLS